MRPRVARLRLVIAVAAAAAMTSLARDAAAARPKPRAAPKTAPAPPKPKPQRADPQTETVEVTVVEVAGTNIYLSPGASEGVRRGSKVSLGGRTYVVTQSTSSYAIVDVGDEPPSDGEKGRATVVDEEPTEAVKLPKPKPASAYADLWPEAVSPASGQEPPFVPLGDAVERDRRFDLRLTALGGALVPLERGSTIARAELQARLRAEPFSVPLAFLLDASIQSWLGPDVGAREGRSARPLIRARELALRWGKAEGFGADLGRIRWAASTLGTLDGLRLKSTVGNGFTVAAFGGALPDPLSGAPSTSAQRFGVEATYSAPERTLRPEAGIVAHGSTFGGQLDERRLSGFFGVFPGDGRFGGRFEIAGFGADNPFGAAEVEVTNGGLDGSVRFGAVQLGGRLDVRRPERSLWLASYLPRSFFCLTRPPADPATDPNAEEPCDGRGALRVEAAVDASVTMPNVVIAVGGTTARDLGIPDLPSTVGGFGSLRVLRIARYLRADATAAYTTGSYLDMFSLIAGPGVRFADDRVDASLYYRLARIGYATGGELPEQHGVGLGTTLVPSDAVAVGLNGEMIRGSDADALVVLTTLTWRP